MRRDVKSFIADLKDARGLPFALLFGDDLQVRETCAAVLDLLVPAEQRGFNFERFDGRSASWDQIEASLMTPPLFPGKKLIWVENAPYFFSRDQRGELGEKVLELWDEGQKDEAAKLLVDLLVLEGWTQEQWERHDRDSSRALLKLFDSGSAERRDGVLELVAYCQEHHPQLSGVKSADDHRLVHLLEQRLPEWSFLMLTALQVDRRTRLYKLFEEWGAAIFLGPERDRYGKMSRESLLEFVVHRVAGMKKTLEPRAREMLVGRAGDDLRGLGQELDKLLLFVGDSPVIRAADVEAVVADRGEGWIFDLTRAVGERDARAALAQLARLLARGEHPLKILGTVAAEVRRLLAARQLLGNELARLWRRGMTYSQFQRTVLQDGAPWLTRNPYADYMCMLRAERFSLEELDGYMEQIFEADLRLKSSRSQPRLVIEKLILEMCLKSRRGKPHGPAAP